MGKKERDWKEEVNRRLDPQVQFNNRIRNMEVEQRERRRVDDDFREKYMAKYEFGRWDIANIPITELWQKAYLDKFGVAYDPKKFYVCPRCKTPYATGYPPVGGCTQCKRMDGKFTPTPIDDLIKARAWKR